jgi:hypothetical protein
MMSRQPGANRRPCILRLYLGTLLVALQAASVFTAPALMRWRGRDGSSVLTWRTLWGYGASADLGLRQNGLTTAISQMPRFLEDVWRNGDDFRLPKNGFIADGSDIKSPTERVRCAVWLGEPRPPLETDLVCLRYWFSEHGEQPPK